MKRIAITILLSACVNTHPIELLIEPNGLEPGQNVGVRVAASACPIPASASILAHARVDESMSVTLATLPAGTYAFEVEARDVNCDLDATGCVTQNLRTAPPTITIPLTLTFDEGDVCPGLEVCPEGFCVSASGITDAGR